MSLILISLSFGSPIGFFLRPEARSNSDEQTPTRQLLARQLQAGHCGSLRHQGEDRHTFDHELKDLYRGPIPLDSLFYISSSFTKTYSNVIVDL